MVSGIANVIASYYMAKNYGVIGVCLTIGVIFILRSVALNVVYKKVLKIDILTFFKECHFKMFPGMFVSVLGSAFFVKFFPLASEGLQGWIYLAIQAAVITVVFFLSMWILGWNSYEKQLIKSFIPKRFRNNQL